MQARASALTSKLIFNIIVLIALLISGVNAMATTMTYSGSNGVYTLTWNCTGNVCILFKGATSVHGSGPGNGSYTANLSTGSHTFKLETRVYNSGGYPVVTEVDQVTITYSGPPPPPPPPTVTATFSPSTITEGQSSTLTWSSTNATSCSATGISGVSGTSGTRVYTASSTMSADQDISVTVTCTGSAGSASKVANLHIDWVNDSPTISNITDKSTNEGVPLAAFSFTVGDEETAANLLTVTATSGNSAVITDSNIQIGGSGATRNLTLVPNTTGSGTSTITVTVKDANNALRSDSFILTVNDMPGLVTIDNITSTSSATSYRVSWSRGKQVAQIQERVGTSGAWTNIHSGSIVGPQGYQTITKTSDGTYYYKMRDCLYNGSSPYDCMDSSLVSTVVNLPDPTVTVSFNSSSILEGGSATLSWSSTNATSCSATGISGVSATSGTATFNAPSSMSADLDHVVSVTCSGPGGTTSKSASIHIDWINDPPTISDIANQTVQEDHSTGNINFTVYDEESTGSLSITGASSNQALVPSGNIFIGGSGSSRTVNVIPAPNQYGTTTITISVSDGSNPPVTDSFNVTVSSVNDLPTISNISNRSTNEGTPTGVINFTVGDVETAAELLTVTATSDNPSVVSNTNIQLNGSGASRNLVITPNSTGFGTSTITVTVRDANNAFASDTFVLTVNDMPALITVSDTTSTSGIYSVSWSRGKQVAQVQERVGANGSWINIHSGSVVGPQGSQTITKLSDGTFFYRIRDCLYNGSSPYDCVDGSPVSVVVDLPAPTISASFSPSQINEGQSAVLTWNTTNANSCSATGITGVSAASGNVSYPAPDNLSADFIKSVVLTCTGGGGSTTQTVNLPVKWINDTPTITTIPTQNILEDTATAVLNFNVADEETVSHLLDVTATSSDINKIPVGNITLGTNGNSRTVRVVPTVNANGNVTITLRVSDGQNTATSSFVVAIASENDPPEISDIDDREIYISEATSVTIPFTAFDAETGYQDLVVSYTRSGSTFTKPVTYSLGGSNSQGERTFYINTGANNPGSVLITLKVRDQAGVEVTESFKFTAREIMGAEEIAPPITPAMGDPSLVSVSQQNEIDAVGAFSGQFRVNESGAVNYSVPLKVVEGTAGVTPQISLVYASNGDNGPMGKGWTIGGIDAISRCRQTLLQDSSARAIAWNANDRFCFNGQRLLLTSGSTYGSPGTEYKTELDSFIKVKAVGGTAGHPDYFEVYAKDGSVTQYGGTGEHTSERAAYSNGSRVPNRVASWSKSRFEDSVGNAIIFEYAQAADYFHISNIYYGAGSAPSSSNYTGRIHFDFLARTDLISGWSSGYEFKNNKRLSQVNVYSGSTKVRYYAMDYTHPASYKAPNGLSRIDTVQECTSNNVCLPALDFDWGEKGTVWKAIGGGFVVHDEELLAYTSVDLNGDGIQDNIWAVKNGSNAAVIKHRIVEADGTSSYGTSILSDKKPSFYPIDLNADGRMDLMYYGQENKTWYYLLSRADADSDTGWSLGDDFTFASAPDLKVEAGSSNRSGFDLEKSVTFGDLNSDGLTDIVLFSEKDFSLKVYYLKLKDETYGDGSAKFEFVHNDVSDSFPIDVSVAGGNWWEFDYAPKLGDFNGDGLLDVALAANKYFSYTAEPGHPYPIGSAVLTYRNLGSGLQYYAATLFQYYNGDDFLTATNGIPTDGIIQSIQSPDINGDGLNDLAAFNGYEWKFVLSTGAGFTSNSTITSVSSYGMEKLSTKNIDFADIDSDGSIEVLWKSNINSSNPYLIKPILYKSWDPVSQSFSSNKTFDSATPSEINGDASLSILDKNGDGSLDRMYLLTSSSSNHKSLFTEVLDYELDAIDKITSGFGTTTEIKFEPLTTSEHYSTIEGISSEEIIVGGCGSSIYTPDIDFCFPESVVKVTDATELYRQIYEPFDGLDSPIPNHAPIMEVRGPMYVVTEVSSNVPTLSDTTNRNSVDYFYETARVQAGGRGFLGFKKLTTRDAQNGIFTETSYRQDWPYTGQPIETVKLTFDGIVLSREANQHTIYNYDSLSFSNLATTGTKALGSLQVYASHSLSTSYDLVANGASQGNPLSTVVTLNTPDAFGNSDTLEIATLVGGSTVNSDGTFAEEPDYSVTDYYSKKKVENEYYNSDEGKFLGRLISSTATIDRSTEAVAADQPTQKTKVSEFTYYGLNGSCTAGQGGELEGLLCDEIIKENGTVQLTTRHHYDQFGNETWNYAWGPNNEARISAFVAYDSNGRYPITTYNAFNGQLSSTSVNDSAYSTTADALEMSVLKTSQVISRDAYGTPTEVRTWVDESNYVVSRTYTTTGGNVYFTASSDGSYTQSLATDDDTTNCPADAEYITHTIAATGSESRSCFDLLGRKRRSLTLGFDGSWVAIDTEYDNQNRPYRVSDPYFVSSDSASLWTSTVYDLLGRSTGSIMPFELTDIYGAPIGTLASSSIVYEGLSVTTTSPGVGGGPDIVKTEIKNILGELISVTEREGPSGSTFVTAHYGYDVDGNLVSLIDPANNLTTISYGVMGQKTGMEDLNKGVWSYQYSAFGDLLCQRDAKGNIIKQFYDGRGRMLERVDYTGGTCASPSNLKSQAVWEYDVADNGLGQVSDEQDLTSGFGVVYSYDVLGRLIRTTTAIPGTSASDLSYHHSAQNYDQYGRVHQSFDAARHSATFNRGATQNIYNDYGYLDKIVDAHNVGYGGVEYYDVETMDARGNVVHAYLADGVMQTTNTFNESTGRLEGISTSTNSLNAIQNMEMRWDHLGNLRSRTDSGRNKAGSLRNFSEEFSYDVQNRLTTFNVTNNDTNAVQSLYVTYYGDGTGNIQSKSDVGAYFYENGRPHAVSSAGGTNYAYDANGSVTSDGTGRSFSYTAFDKVAQIELNNRRTNFYYGTGRARYKRVDTNLSPNPDEVVTTLYIGGVEKIYYHDNSVEWKRSIGGMAQITYKFNKNATAPNGLDYTSEKLVYFLKDHLGSINAITDKNGQILEEVMFFDPWGARRKPETYQLMSTTEIASAFFKTVKPHTSRGFTGHEMVDEMNIIHMNARIYDPKLARMLQADSIIPDPTILASLNRYSYVYNNPLNATDPTGHNPFLVGMAWGAFFGAAGKALDAPWLTAVGGILMCASGGLCDAAQIAKSIGAAAGFAFGSTYSATGNLGASIKSAGIAAFTSAAFIEAGTYFRESARFVENGAMHVFSHAMIGGVSSVLQGGKFGHGFFSAGFVKAVTPSISKLDGWQTADGKSLEQAFAAAVVGGTVSVATGGKFANGALTAAMGNLLNNQGGYVETGMVDKEKQFYADMLTGGDTSDEAFDKFLRDFGTEYAKSLAIIAASETGGALIARLWFRAFGGAATGYHATFPEAAAAIRRGGFNPGTSAGRLGSHGTYVNNTPEGAIAEFAFHHPGVNPAVLQVEYSLGVNATACVAPRNYVFELPLFVDSISAPSLRYIGSVNTNVLNGSVKVVK